MNNPFEDDAFVYLVRDTVTGGYLKSSKYWEIGINNLVPKSQGVVYIKERNANALRNKAGKEFKGDVERNEYCLRNNPPNDPKIIQEIANVMDDWEKRKKLPHFGFETIKIKI